MTTSRFLMTWRMASQPSVWPRIFEIGASIEAIDPMLRVSVFDRDPIVWKKEDIHSLVIEAVKQFDVLRQDNPLHKLYLLTFGMESKVNLQFTLMHNEMEASLVSTLLIFKDRHITGEDAFGFETIMRVFEEIIGVTGSNLAYLSKPPAVQEEWYYETARQIDVYRAPNTVEWINFFGQELCDQIGREKLDNVPEGASRPFANGYIITLQTEPFSNENPEHRKKQKHLHEFLEFDRIHEVYLKTKDKSAGVKKSDKSKT